MFSQFFYQLKDVGIPVSPTAFLTLQRALHQGLIRSLDDFYSAARAILVKSERHFDRYDQVFAHHFEGADLPDPKGLELDEVARMLLEQWLQRPQEIAAAFGVDQSELSALSPDELIQYFKDRLADQDGEHHGG
ncbi:MAG: hypothetical protein WBG37_03565, partial [Desulfobacterales bacterium]